MTSSLVAYGAALVSFLAIDYIWLGFIARDFYRERLGHLMLDTPNLGVAAAFYLLYMVAVVVLVVNPALDRQQWTTAILYGALFGLVAYGTYDITNLATLKGWPISVVIVDMAWGMTLTATASVIAYFVANAVR